MIDLLLDALAAYRLTRLVTADTILDGPRDDIVRGAYVRAWEARNAADPIASDLGADLRWAGEVVDPKYVPGDWAEYAQVDPRAPKLAVLVTCRWCAGMWVALGVVAARRFAPWAPLARALAFSAGAALLARVEDD